MIVDMNVEFQWWRPSDSAEPEAKKVLKRHEDDLKKAAKTEIFSKLQAGVTQGELTANLCVSNEDPNEGVDYRGYWMGGDSWRV